jgi:ankyrin repeat protein
MMKYSPHKYCQTALMLACGNGYEAVLEVLLNHGADINELDQVRMNSKAQL